MEIEQKFEVTICIDESDDDSLLTVGDIHNALYGSFRIQNIASEIEVEKT